MTLHSDHVRVHQQQLAAVGGERVVLAQDARRDEGQDRPGLGAGDAPGDGARLDLGCVSAAGHHPHGLCGGADPLGAVDDPRLLNRAALDQTGGLTYRNLRSAGRLGQFVDRLPAGVFGGRRFRSGQFAPERGSQVPVHRPTHCEPGPGFGAHDRHPQERRVAANASSAVRPVGPASLDSNAKVSTRPLSSVTMPASELVPVSDPVLARR